MSWVCYFFATRLLLPFRGGIVISYDEVLLSLLEKGAAMDKVILDALNGYVPIPKFVELPKPESLEIGIRQGRSGVIYNSIPELTAYVLVVVQSTGLGDWLKGEAWTLLKIYLLDLYGDKKPNRPAIKAKFKFQQDDKIYEAELDDITKISKSSFELIRTIQNGTTTEHIKVETTFKDE